MATITKFLPAAVYNRMEHQQQVLQNVIDFSKKNAASGDVVHAIRIPKGMLVERVALAVHTTEATVTIAVGDSASATQFLTAQTLTDIKADNTSTTLDGATQSLEANDKFYGEDSILYLTVGGAAATTAVISVAVQGILIAKTAAETAVES